MASTGHGLHILFFPFLAPGHMNPMVDTAKICASRGAKVTILTTSGNAAAVRPAVHCGNSSNSFSAILLHLIPFPGGAAGLPEGLENMSSIPSPDLITNFLKALFLLRPAFSEVVAELRPDCVVSDVFLPWTCEVAAERGVPRVVFYPSNFFSMCALHSIEEHKPLETLPPDGEPFALPGLPHRIEMLPSQIRDPKKMGSSATAIYEVFKQVKEVESKNHGVLVNSFYELEPDYVDYCRNVMGKKAWPVGPVALCNQYLAGASSRGGDDSIDGSECLKWLDGKNPGSVVYICFGSSGDVTADQLREIALGLEASGHLFVWAMRDSGEDWIPEGFEERIEGRGLMIRGWAPQLLILNHPAVGGFVVHCGWNSSIEGIAAGLPAATWPMLAEHFYTERLLVDVLKIGVEVGSKLHSIFKENRPVVEAAAVEAAVRSLMDGGEEAVERRKRARELGKKARMAVEEGGSSSLQIDQFLQELAELKSLS